MTEEGLVKLYDDITQALNFEINLPNWLKDPRTPSETVSREYDKRVKQQKIDRVMRAIGLVRNYLEGGSD